MPSWPNPVPRVASPRGRPLSMISTSAYELVPLPAPEPFPSSTRTVTRTSVAVECLAVLVSASWAVR